MVTCAAGMAAVLASGCSTDKEKYPMMTYQQAADTVEQLIKEAVAPLNPAPRMDDKGGVRMVPCSGPNDDQETGTSMVEHDYWLRDLDPNLNDEIFRQVRQHWADQGYTVVRESGGNNDAFHKLVVRHPTNGFRVSVTDSDGYLMVRAQSNCVPNPEA